MILSTLRRASAVLGRSSLLFAGGCWLLTISVLLLQTHAVAIRQMRGDTLPLAAKAATLSTRLAILRKQVEASKLAASLQTGFLEEKLHVYALPADADVERTITLLTAATDLLKKRGTLRESTAIAVGEARSATGALASGRMSLVRRPLTFTLTGREAGLKDFFTLLNLSGLLTVKDALTPAEIQELFTLTEAENPTGVVALGTFLSADLLTYLREPRAIDERLLSSFSSDAFSALVRGLNQSSFFQAERALLGGGFGDVLIREKLWPLPFLEVSRAEVEDVGNGWLRVSLGLEGYGRAE